jgi:hypothetical protein
VVILICVDRRLSADKILLKCRDAKLGKRVQKKGKLRMDTDFFTAGHLARHRRFVISPD